MRKATPRLLTISQVADYLGVSTKTVQRLVKSGTLKHHYITDRLVRIAEADANAFIAARRR